MTNNQILRRLRYTFSLNDTKMMELFALGGYNATRTEISDWLKKDEQDDFQPIIDFLLATFLNGLIIDKRGKKDGEPMIAEEKLNNNIIFRKLKIALNLKDIDILYILDSVHFPISSHELSALFRKPDQKQYKECQNQLLRNFLMGVQLKYHVTGDQSVEMLKPSEFEQ